MQPQIAIAFSLTFIATHWPEVNMKMKEVLAAIIGLAAAAGAIFYFYKFVTFEEATGGHRYGYYSLGLAAVAFVCGLLYFLGHVNQEEEIHITQ
ncbi:MAG TPA: hypothetical protein DCK99_10780 [Blastocatellia bacterium]|jgi:1,4-dihydroxy-2-naphthoate octaprenyltransferase|nr:hypothetical protein [Blastocatellia bacterium]